MSILRLLRLLKPLRTLKLMPGVQLLVNALLKVLKHHFVLVTILMFCIMTAILPLLQWYPLTMTGRCAPANESLEVVAFRAAVQTYRMDEELCNLDHSGGRRCSLFEACFDVGRSPVWNLRNFDGFGTGSLSLLQCSTLDGWTSVFKQMLDAVRVASHMCYAQSMCMALRVLHLFNAYAYYLCSNLCRRGLDGRQSQCCFWCCCAPSPCF